MARVPSRTATASHIDELPIEGKEKNGLQFVLHYSVPVFVEPVGATVAPQLHWTLQRNGDHTVLEEG